MNKLQLLTTAAALAFAGAIAAQTPTPQQPGQPEAGPATSPTEGTAADQTPPGQTQTTPQGTEQTSPEPMPSTSPTEGTAADRTPPPGEQPAGTTTPPQGAAPPPDTTSPETTTSPGTTSPDTTTPGTTTPGTTSPAPPPQTGGSADPGMDDTATQQQQEQGATRMAMADESAMNKHRASKIIEMSVQNPDGDRIGQVEDVIVDSNGQVTHAIVAYGGTLGFGDKLTAVPWSTLTSMIQGDTVVMDQARLEQAPRFDENSWPNVTSPGWSTQVDQYWGADRMRSATGPMPGEQMPPEQQQQQQQPQQQPQTNEPVPPM